MLVKELIEKLQSVNLDAHIIFDDDIGHYYPIIDVADSVIDCETCEETHTVNDYPMCAAVNKEYVHDYSPYCEKYTRKDVVTLTTNYQRSGYAVKYALGED